MPVSNRHRDEMKEWEVYRKIIHRLYIVQNMSPEEVARHMAKHYQFFKRPRMYEYRCHRWNYRQKIDKAKQESTRRAIERRAKQGKESQVMYSGTFRSLPAPRSRTPPTLADKYLLKSEGQIPTRETTPLRLRTPPPLSIWKNAWPGDLPWFNFEKKFSGVLTAHLLRADVPTSPLNDLQRGREGTVIPAIPAIRVCRDASISIGQSIDKVSNYLDLLSPETYQGEHVASAEILLTGAHESASIELLKLAVYLLSNNMESELYRLTNAPLRQDPVDILRSSGILTKESIHWLMNASDETSEALKDTFLRKSLETDDSDILRWVLSGGMDVERVILRRATIILPEKPHARFDDQFKYNVNISLTPLQFASFRGSNDCCQVLLDAGADPNVRASDQSPLPLEYATMRSSSAKSTSLIKLLLHKGADLDRCLGKRFGMDLLWLAIHQNHLFLVKKLLQRGENISPLMFTAAAESSTEMLSLISAARENWAHPTLESPLIKDMLLPSALCMATKQLENLKFLLDVGADPNRLCRDIGWTPLEFACRWRNKYAVDILLQHGVNPSIQNAALPIAIQSESCSIIRKLLDAGANVNLNYNSCPFRRAPLTEALYCANIEVVELLLQHQSLFSGSELTDAIAIGDIHILEMLFEAGAQFQGDELSFAAEFRDIDIIELLLEKGATTTNSTLSLEIALLTRNVNEASTALQHAMYDSRCLFEATLFALNSKQHIFVVERLVSRRTTMKRDAFELAALAIAVFNQDSQLCYILSDPRFLPGPWTFDLYLYVDEDFLIKKNTEGIFEIHPSSSRSQYSDIRWQDYRTPGTIHILEISEEFDKEFEVDYALRYFLELGACYDSEEFDRLGGGSYMKYPSALAQVIQARLKDGSLTGKTINPSPLVAAVLWVPGLVKVLLDGGIDANENPGLVYPWRDKLHTSLPSRTPLQAAIEKCNMTVVSQLLESGADINAPPGCTRGATCLQIAAINGHIGMARMLLDCGAMVNAPRARVMGRTAIEGAAERGRLDMTKLLLSRLTDVPDSQQHRIQFIRAVKFAIREGHNTVAKVLKNHIQWNEDDERLYESTDLDKPEIVDGMTQELSTFESSMIDWSMFEDGYVITNDSDDESSSSDSDDDDEFDDERAVDYEILNDDCANAQSASMSPELSPRSIPDWARPLSDPDPFMGYSYGGEAEDISEDSMEF
ncbi:ankyrin [Rostrohypoxylon terebratum]|nr:ankyrin [Rostrohypoxylon terebratum]